MRTRNHEKYGYLTKYLGSKDAIIRTKNLEKFGYLIIKIRYLEKYRYLTRYLE